MTLRCLCRKIIRQCVNSRPYSKEEPKCVTAGIVVIGDEILKGTVPDINSTFLAQELHKLGVTLKKISVIPDDVEQIRVEVKNFSSSFNYVLTTGGIGPTHDDLTYEGVALAFDEPLFLHPELKDICRRFYRTEDPSGAGMKLAHVPRSSRLHYLTTSGGKLAYPNVAVRNVYMFPGVPELLKRTIIEAGPLLFPTTNKFFTKTVYCNVPEHKIIKELNQLIREFPEVEFGCYPNFFDSVYKVKVSIESCSEKATVRAYKRLLELVPMDSIINKVDDV